LAFILSTLSIGPASAENWFQRTVQRFGRGDSRQANAQPAARESEQDRYFRLVQGFNSLPTDRDHPSFGLKAFRDAKAFAQANNVQHFVTTLPNGQQRVVMNVVGREQLRAYCRVFSPENGYQENFFCASATSKPGWSYHRIGDRSYQEFGQGGSYDMNVGRDRVAFPYGVSATELQANRTAIHDTPAPPFDWEGEHIGGVLSAKRGSRSVYKRNCTDWITSIVGRMTGVETNSVVHHAGSLWSGSCSARMTVQTFITGTPIQSFGQDQLRRNW
jgi:hypothetical protein